METDNNKLLDNEMMTGMFGAMGRNLKRSFTVFTFLGLLTLNVLTLARSTVHDILYGVLSSIPNATMAELLANSPTENKMKLAIKNKDLKNKVAKQKKKFSKHKITATAITKRMKTRISRTTALNVSSAIGEATPVIGIAIILAVTAIELKDACDNMKDIDKLEQSLGLGSAEVQTTTVCGLMLPTLK